MSAYRAEGFDPPAPFTWITVHGPDGQAQSDVPLLLDTGSDLTIVPRSAVLAVGVPPSPSGRKLEFYDGSTVESEVAEVTIEVLALCFRARFPVSDADYGILGRNILNRFVVTFDGPNLTWSA